MVFLWHNLLVKIRILDTVGVKENLIYILKLLINERQCFVHVVLLKFLVKFTKLTKTY